MLVFPVMRVKAVRRMPANKSETTDRLPPFNFTLLQSCPTCSNPMHFHERSRANFAGVWFCYQCNHQKWSEAGPLRIRREEYMNRLDEFLDEWISLDHMIAWKRRAA